MNSIDNLLERKSKQKYLRENIDPAQAAAFSNYLLSKRADGTNVDVWNFEELKTEVAVFKKLAEDPQLYSHEISFDAQDLRPHPAQLLTSQAPAINPMARKDHVEDHVIPEMASEMSKIIEDNHLYSSELIVDKRASQVQGDNAGFAGQPMEKKRRVVVNIGDEKKGIYELVVDGRPNRLSRKLADFYWLHGKLRSEFPYYYVA